MEDAPTSWKNPKKDLVLDENSGRLLHMKSDTFSVYDMEDEILGEFQFLGFHKIHGDPMFDSTDFSEKQVDFLAKLVDDRIGPGRSNRGAVTITAEQAATLKNL